MKINKQFIAAQGAKALTSKPGGCCGTAASKQFVFPTDQPEIECMLNWTYGAYGSPSGQLDFSFHATGINVPVTITVNISTSTGGFATLVVGYVNTIPTPGGTSYILFENGSSYGDVNITVPPNQYLVFQFLDVTTQCEVFFLTMNNITCAEDFGPSGEIGINLDYC